MSSNVLTDDQPDESIKKFKFKTKGDKEEIEITIPEVNCSFEMGKPISVTNMVL